MFHYIHLMSHRLLRFALSRKHPEPRMFPSARPINNRYDVVIIGGGNMGRNTTYSTRGHFTVAHADADADAALRTMRHRAEVNKHQMIGVSIIALCTSLSPGPTYRVWCDPSFGDYLINTLEQIATEQAA